jgi:ribosome biogenesis protein UTP30
MMKKTKINSSVNHKLGKTKQDDGKKSEKVKNSGKIAKDEKDVAGNAKESSITTTLKRKIGEEKPALVVPKKIVKESKTNENKTVEALKVVSEKKTQKKRPLSSSGKESTSIALPDLSKRPTTDLLKLASVALLQHVTEFEKAKKQKTALLPGLSKENSAVFLQVGLRNMPEQALKTFKGWPIELPHPMREIETSSICMFVKDKEEAKKWLGDDYEKHGIRKIISLQQLRTKYKSFQDRRELADLYDAFVADDRIVCMLPKTLGKAFYVGSKRPLPVRLAKKEKLAGSVTAKIQKALRSAFFYLPGVSTSIRVGSTDMTPDQLVANLEKVIDGVVEHIPGQWKGVQSLFLKSEKSAALPLYEAIASVEKDENVKE